jgi:hypothetical protein
LDWWELRNFGVRGAIKQKGKEFAPDRSDEQRARRGKQERSNGRSGAALRDRDRSSTSSTGGGRHRGRRGVFGLGDGKGGKRRTRKG